MINSLFMPAADGAAAWGLALDLSMKVTALYLLALLLHFFLGRRRPLLRSGLWNALLASLVVLPIATLKLPRLRVDLPRTAVGDLVESRQVNETTSKTSSMALNPRIDDQAATFKVGRTRSGVDSSSKTQTPVETGNRSPRFGLTSTVLFFYFAGCMILLIRLVGSLWMARLLKQSAMPVTEPAWSAGLDAWRSRLHVRRRVELIESEHVRVPLAVGWFRPAIVLPPERHLVLAASQIDAVLVHELGHLERRDDVWNLIQQVVQILYWPHPLTWVAARMVAEVREQACDDFCVHWAGGAEKYWMALIAVAAGLVEGEQPQGISIAASPLSLGMARARSSSTALRRRLDRIARRSGTPRCQLRWVGRTLFAALGLFATFAVGSIELARPSVALAQPAQEKAFLAYDQPFPDSVRRAIVDVTVIDASTRAPVVDAEVMVLNYVDLVFHPARTNQQGRIRVVYPYAEEPSVNIEVRKEGYVPQRSSWGGDKRKDGPPRDVTIALRRGAPMGGLVIDEAGQPIEGVTVVASVDKCDPDDRLKDTLGYEIFFEVPLRTGADGRWRTDSLPPSAQIVSLSLIHPDYVSGGSRTMLDPGLRHPQMSLLRSQLDQEVMTKGVKVTGRVVDAAGQPIPRARVTESSSGLSFLTYARHTVSDAEGRFHFHFNPNEKVTLTTQVKGYEPVTKSLVVKQGIEPIEFRLEPGRVIRGRVVDLSGKPIPAANIIIPVRSSHQGVFLRTWTDTEGRFRWDSGPSKAVELSIGKYGYVWIERLKFLPFDHETLVTLKPALYVTITAQDVHTGKPVQQFSVETGVSDPGTGDVTWKPALTRVVTEGEYRTTLDATAGPYRFRVTSIGYAASTSRGVEGKEKEAALVINLEKLPIP